MIKEIFERVKFWRAADRIGPDIIYTHWRLYFKSTMRKICKKKFKYFAANADFRPGAYAICCSKISIGARVVIRPETMMYADPGENGAGITIEEDVLIGSGVHIYAGNHNYDKTDIPIIDQAHMQSKKVVLKRGSWIGAKVVILPGVTIGENAVVGAGSIVTKDIPARVVVAGNPARIIKEIK